MFIPTLVFIAAFTQPLSARRGRAVFRSFDNTVGKYPFVVTLLTQSRHCTGSFITPNWVLTAAHCFPFSERDNMTIHAGETSSIGNSRNLKLSKPPPTFSTTADIGLLYVHTAHLKAYGRLATIDYKDLLGRTVEFADFDYYYKKWKRKNYTSEVTRDESPRLQFGEGIVRTCDTQSVAPHICVMALASNKEMHSFFGDPGGPLFYDGKVVGVLAGNSLDVRYYTPISPYLSWLHKVHTAPIHFRSNGKPSILSADVPVPTQHQMIQNLSQYLLGLKARLSVYREKVLSSLLQEFQKRRRSSTARNREVIAITKNSSRSTSALL